MAKKILIATNTTPIVFSDTTDYDDGFGIQTTDCTIIGLVAGAARQSDKDNLDNGLVSNRYARRYAVSVAAEWETAPTAGGTVDIYWAPSVSATAATANPAGVTGSDSAYSGTAGSTLAESLLQLQFLGSLIVTNDAGDTQLTTFVTKFGTQYGTLVVVNNTDQDIADNVSQVAVVFTPIEEEVQ